MTDVEARLARLEESVFALEGSFIALAKMVRDHIATDSLALEHRLSDLAIIAASLPDAPPPRRVQ